MPAPTSGSCATAACPASSSPTGAATGRGAKPWPVEQLIKWQCADTAALIGFNDRGTLASGQRADINLIDFDRLSLRAPEMVFDLPAGGRRLIQKADGFVATLVAGQAVLANGELTGARPGQLVRS